MDWTGCLPRSLPDTGLYKTLRNTLMLNLLDLLVSFPAPLILAIMPHELRIRWFKRLSQTILYIPHFISWVIIGGIVYQVFGTQSGMINNMLMALGFDTVPFLTEKYMAHHLPGDGCMAERRLGNHPLSP